MALLWNNPAVKWVVHFRTILHSFDFKKETNLQEKSREERETFPIFLWISSLNSRGAEQRDSATQQSGAIHLIIILQV